MGINTDKKQGWTEPDNTVRCPHCCAEAGGQRAGTPLSEITVKVMSDDPWIPVAKATICRRCRRIYRVFLLPDAQKLRITRIGIGRCLKATRCAESFKINELQSGIMDEVVLSETVKKAMIDHPCRSEYNPDKYIQSELPEPQLNY